MTFKEFCNHRWPLFKASLLSDGSISLDTTKGIWTLKSIEAIDQSQGESLDKTHLLAIKTQDLMKQYPYLHISWYEKNLGVWINANGQDREGLGEVSHSDTQEMHKRLADLNKKVKIISENPSVYFLCSGCNKCLYMSREVALSGNINRLIDEQDVYFKFNPPSANYYCELCVETDSYAKSQYALYKKLGSKYYD